MGEGKVDSDALKPHPYSKGRIIDLIDLAGDRGATHRPPALWILLRPTLTISSLG